MGRRFVVLLIACSMAVLPSLIHGTSLDTTPITFVKNVGQWPDSVLFRADAGAAMLWLTGDGIYYQFARRVPNPQPNDTRDAKLSPRVSGSVETAAVKAQFVGANPHAQIVASEPQDYRCNFFVGDPASWRANVPTYAAVTFKDIYPGVDATLRSDKGRLAYQLQGTAQATSQVTVQYLGAPAAGRADGSVTLQTALGEMVFSGLLPVAATESSAPQLSPNAPPSTLTLVYSTYLGGGQDDGASGVAIDKDGNAYVAGSTFSLNFPTQSPFQPSQGAAGFYDVFVTKLSATGSMVYSTYLGGNSHDFAYYIAVDTSGCAYVCGETYSSNFPTQSAYQAAGTGYDAFVTKLSAAGNSLVYSTYLGGTGSEYANAIALDHLNCAYVTGLTRSTDFPTQNPMQATSGGGYSDAFVTKLSATGTNLIYSTYLGGTDLDAGNAIVVDGSGNAFVTGYTFSPNYPTKTPYQTDPDNGDEDAFVTKLATAGNSLVYSTYLGGGLADVGYGIAIDTAGAAYITGLTSSTDFPALNAYQLDQVGSDAFATKVSPGGTALAYSTYLGGGGADCGLAIAVDLFGSACATGWTRSTDFPTQTPYQIDPGDGTDDIFVTKLAPAGNSFHFSTYLGGTASDLANGIATDGAGKIYLTGLTNSTDFPLHVPFQATAGGGGFTDAFVSRIAFDCCTGTTGNVNISGIIDLSDLSWLIDYLTRTPHITLPCPDAANVNATGIIDLVDLSWLIDYMTIVPRRTLPNCP